MSSINNSAHISDNSKIQQKGGSGLLSSFLVFQTRSASDYIFLLSCLCVYVLTILQPFSSIFRFLSTLLQMYVLNRECEIVFRISFVFGRTRILPHALCTGKFVRFLFLCFGRVPQFAEIAGYIFARFPFSFLG